jgi:hypothetical protein
MVKRSGVVRYSCNRGYFDEPQQRLCSSKTISPGNGGYFYHPPLAKGNAVKLTVLHAEGPRTQMRGWNRITGETLDTFELLNFNLERRSLLALGKNKITYQIIQKEEVVASGSFEVTVTEKIEKCASRYLGVSNGWDYYRCIHDERICKEYLEDFAGCQ